jgi:hypothetical protein
MTIYRAEVTLLDRVHFETFLQTCQGERRWNACRVLQRRTHTWPRYIEWFASTQHSQSWISRNLNCSCTGIQPAGESCVTDSRRPLFSDTLRAKRRSARLHVRITWLSRNHREADSGYNEIEGLFPRKQHDTAYDAFLSKRSRSSSI